MRAKADIYQVRYRRVQPSSSRGLYWTIAKRKIWKCREMGPVKKGTRWHTCSHVSPTSPLPPPTSRERPCDHYRQARSTSAATSHSNATATTPMDAERTEMPTIPGSSLGYACVLVDCAARSSMFLTDIACHWPPRAVATPLALSASAICSPQRSCRRQVGTAARRPGFADGGVGPERRARLRVI
jgi:hypothetical protein